MCLTREDEIQRRWYFRHL